MTEPTASLSRVDFDHLIARASKLDDEGNERIDLDHARAIAHELGISASAWDAALRERETVIRAEGVRAAAWRARRRAVNIALVGIVAGGLSGTLANQLADGVLPLGAVAIGAAVALLVDGLRRRSLRGTQVDLAAWWLSVPAGIMLGMREFHVDPMVFAASSWVGCAALGFTVDRLRRRALARPAATAGTAQSQSALPA